MTTMTRDSRTGTTAPPDTAQPHEDGWPEPAIGTQEEAIKAGLKASRSIGLRRITTREITATGQAFANWFLFNLDLWMASNLLSPDQKRILWLYFREPHPCSGSGAGVAKDVGRVARCVRCQQNVGVHPRRRRMVVHERQYGNEDVAREMGIGTTKVKELKREAIAIMKAYIWPPQG